MLVKVGRYRINLAHIAFVEDSSAISQIDVRFVNGEKIRFGAKELCEQFLTAWDKWAAFQNDAQEMNEFAVRQSLEQIKAAQNKSGIVIPKMTTPRGRG